MNFRTLIIFAAASVLAMADVGASAAAATQSNRLRPRPVAPPSAEEIRERAVAVAAVAAPGCEVQVANLLGMNADRHGYYEVSCASGPGYLLVASEPPQAIDCTILTLQSQARSQAGQVEVEAEDEKPATVACSIPENVDVMRVLSGYARDAGVQCDIDEAGVVGRAPDDSVIYEIGCRGAQGYWIKQDADIWETTECLEILTQNATCRFTTTADAAASIKGLLAGSEGAACDVNQARFIGENANGRFYEAKCAAGNGLIARIKDTAVQQIYPCETAQRIGGGCTLTQVAAAPATTEQN